MMHSFNEFYVGYRLAHGSKQNRVLHFTGVLQLIACIVAALVTGTWWFIAVGVFMAYLLPGIGHRHFEKNKSMRISNPVYCVLGAGKMFFDSFRRSRQY